MLLSTLKLVTCRIPPAAGENGSHPNVSKVTSVNRQALPALKVPINSMKEREQPLLQERSTVSSRRGMMHLTAVTLCFPSLFFPATAEARPINATTKQKITEKVDELKGKGNEPKQKIGEKVDELKQKTGFSKPNDVGKLGNEPKQKIGEKVDELKQKTGSGLSKLNDQVKGNEPKQMIGEKVDELKQKIGLSKPKDEGKGNEPKYNEEKNSKPTNEKFGIKPKSKDDVGIPFVGTQ